MFIPSLGKRSNYKVIEEEEDQQQSQMSSTFGQNPPLLRDDDEEEEEEDEQDQEGGRSMFESAPPNHHGIAVSYKKSGGSEKDPESKASSSDDPAQWDHIKDVDQFFAYIYEYYQQRGFTCIALRYLFSLLRFAFVVLFSTFLLQCVDYDVYFHNRNTTLDGTPLPAKRRIQDAFIPQCHARLNPVVVLALALASAFWLIHLVRSCYRLVQFHEIRRFFASQLQIADADMPNLSWAQVVQKLCQVQQRLHLIVTKESITSLDIYQRILRHKNYFVALVYFDILPPLVRLPRLGSIHYLPTGLRFNLEWLLFWGPWSPWKGPYALREEYKDPKMLPGLARSMERTVALLALANLALFPFVLLYQLLFSFFSYSEHFRRDPNVFGMRKYSAYGREKLRHFNEMDHELEARLNRSYEFAARYTDQFISELAKIVARNCSFVAASIFVVLLALTAYDEDTLQIEHVTMLTTLTGVAVVICRVFIPNENMVFCQQFLMRQIAPNIHYAPKSWLRNAHSTEIHRELTQIFRLKLELLVEELLSPLLSPFILYFCIRRRVPEIVAFLHEHTVHVDGLGDVCSLAQMDICRDGDVRLASLNQSIVVLNGEEAQKQRGKAASSCGKAELSLLNFAAQNPDWQPPKAGAEFIRNVKELVALEMNQPLTVRADQQPMPEGMAASSMDPRTLAFVQMGGAASSSQLLHQMAAQSMDGSAMFFQQQQQQFGAEQPTGPRRASNPVEGMERSRASMTTSRARMDQHQQGQGMPMQTFSFTAAGQSVPDSPTRQATSTSASHSPAHNSAMLPAQQQLAMASSRLIASSFIAPSPLAAIVQPRAVQESNMRASEMSLHALAVNHMLFMNTSMESRLLGLQNNYRGSNNRPPPSGYGSILLGSRQREAGGGSRLWMDSLAESNIWGVPGEQNDADEAASRVQHFEEVDEAAPMPLPLREEKGRLLR